MVDVNVVHRIARTKRIELGIERRGVHAILGREEDTRTDPA